MHVGIGKKGGDGANWMTVEVSLTILTVDIVNLEVRMWI